MPAAHPLAAQTQQQELLDTPNPHSPAQSDAFVMYQQRREEYKKRVKQEAAKYPPPV